MARSPATRTWRPADDLWQAIITAFGPAAAGHLDITLDS
jgi:hypothetical protein